jgi:HSP20 family molecular chaperone IbpA
MLYSIFPNKTDFTEVFNDLIEQAFSSKNFANYPPTDIYKMNKEIFIEIAVAKFKIEDLNVVFENSTLEISGTKSKIENTDIEYINKQIAVRSFVRKFQLSFPISEINYSLEDGILTIQVVPDTGHKKIKINNKSLNQGERNE